MAARLLLHIFEGKLLALHDRSLKSTISMASGLSMGIRILLVDGDTASSTTLAPLLRSFNYQVVVADTGNEALRILREMQHGCNLVLTALNLPDMCSFEFIAAVEHDIRLPVAAICDARSEVVVKAMSSGATYCIVKPMCADDIEHLRNIPALKERDTAESSVVQESGIPRNEPLMHQSGRKRKASELENVNGMSIGESSASASSRTPDAENLGLNVAEDLGIPNAAPSEVAPNVHSPQLSSIPVAGQAQAPAQALAQAQAQAQAQAPVHAQGLGQMFQIPVDMWRSLPSLVSSTLKGSSASSSSSDGSSGSSSDSSSSTSDGSSAPSLSSPSLTDMSIDTDTDDEAESSMHRGERESGLRRYLENPHSRAQLKRLIRGSIAKWDGTVTPMAPPSPGASGVPPISVPLALARYIETFIHTTWAARFAPGELHAMASAVAATPPNVLSEFPDVELEPGFLEQLDTDELFDVIEELRE